MISSQTRLQHLKDSYLSFSDVSDNWLVNIRGELREEALDFLASRLGDKMIRFDLLDEKRGWYANSLDMLKKAKHDYVFLWLEDHINLVPQESYQDIISEMKKSSVDYLMYSWWMDGASRTPFELETLESGQNIDVVKLNKTNWKKRLKQGHQGHLVSLLGIFKKKFLIDILEMENGFKFPRWITTNMFRLMIILSRLGVKFNHGQLFDRINAVLGGRLLRNPKDRPFEFERAPYRLDALPIIMGLSKRELFTCIDDDLSLEGSQLIKRGLYPKISGLKVDFGDKKSYDWGLEEVLSDNDFYLIKRCYLKRCYLKPQKVFSEIYFQDGQRIHVLPQMTVICQSGNLTISIGDKKSAMTSGQTMTIYSNVKYELSTVDIDCKFILVIPKILKKRNI